MNDFQPPSNFDGQTNNPGAPHPDVVFAQEVSSDAPSRSEMPGHGDIMRQTAPEREQPDTLIENKPLFAPSEQPRPVTNEHAQVMRPAAFEHGDDEILNPFNASAPSDGPPRSVVPEEEEPEEIEIIDVIAPAPEAPPEHADLVTVEEAVAIFRERGLPRHMRTIQKYCARKNGRALVCYQVPTENGIRYMIERTSITRFIGDAAQQAPTGKLTGENLEAAPFVERAPSAPSGVDIFEHPFVKRLEEQVERLEDRNQKLQADIQSVLIGANQSLIEVQKANAVAQSETLSTFLLETERLRRQEGDPAQPSPVNREGERFGEITV